MRASMAWPRGWRGSRKGSFSPRSEEHTSELQSQSNIVCRLLLEIKDDSSKFLPHSYVILAGRVVSCGVKADVVSVHRSSVGNSLDAGMSARYWQVFFFDKAQVFC